METIALTTSELNKLPKAILGEIWSWVLPQRDIVSLVSEGVGIESYNLNPPSPHRTFEDYTTLVEETSHQGETTPYPRLQDLPPPDKAVVTSYIFEDSNCFSRTTPSRIPRSTYHWIVKRWPGVNYWSSIQKRYDHFAIVNWENQKLKGSWYSSQKHLVRGTKVLVTEGFFQGKHGVVLGHTPNRHLFHTSPGLVILLPDLTKIQESQAKVELLDPFGYLPFGIPFDPSSLHQTQLHRIQPWDWGSTPIFWGGIHIRKRTWTGENLAVDPFELDLGYWGEPLRSDEYYVPLAVEEVRELDSGL